MTEIKNAIDIKNQLRKKELERYKESLPKEPTDSDAKKEYYVGCYSSEDWVYVHEILMKDGTLEDNIPNHSCECINDCKHSPTRGIYLLTDAEAAELRNSSKVQYVNINTSKYPGTYLDDPDRISTSVSKIPRYSSAVKHQRKLTTDLLSSDYLTFFVIDLDNDGFNTSWITTFNESHRGTTIPSGTSNPSITIYVNDKLYIVNNDSTSNPLWIKTVPGTGTDNAVEGVVGNGLLDSEDGLSNGSTVLVFRPQSSGTYYYQSEIYADMYGEIIVQDYPTVTDSLLNRCGYQLKRHQQKEDPWYGNPNTTIFDDKIQQYGDGSDVDLIVADTTAWFGHIEFQNNLGGPIGYRGGNVLPGNGTCDLLDLILDAPYYLDPDYFNANPETRLTTRWDGTIVPVEFYARYWWGQNSLTYRSSKFVSPSNGGTATGVNDFGSISVPTYYTRSSSNGSNTQSNSYDTHGTACASQAYGRQYGWAYNANKWYLNLYGTFQRSGWEVGFDVQKVFHQIKPVNPKYGTKDPTISSNSWGLRDNAPTSGYYYFRTPGDGTGGTAYDSGTRPEFMKYYVGDNEQTFMREYVEGHSILTAGKELIDSGVIFICASGNNNQKLVQSDHPDYNNYHDENPNTAFINATETSPYTSFSHTWYKSHNRPGFPQQLGINRTTTPYTYKTISVGALDDDYQGDGKERRVYYSNMGNAVDIFASSDVTLAASSPNEYVRYPRYDSSYTIDGVQSFLSEDCKFNGTSSACPIFAGLLATKLQYNRSWTYQDVKDWIASLGTMDSNKFYYGTESTTANDSNWSDSANLQGNSGVVAWDALTGNEPVLLLDSVKFASGNGLVFRGVTIKYT